MKAVLYAHAELAHQLEHRAAMRAGLERHGVTTYFAGYNSPPARAGIDFAVVWGAPSKQPAVARAHARILVLERGHLPDRLAYTACGWDAIGRRGRYAPAADGGARFRARWGDLLRPWRAPRRGDYALVIGQVQGDAALRGLAVDDWAASCRAVLATHGWETRFRPHPLMHRAARPLAEDLAGAGLCVTYNSTAGVEAVLAGVPTVTLDEGAMAWPVAGHTLDAVVRPDRAAWAHDLAWTSFTREELAAGVAWVHLRSVLEEAACSA